MSFSMTSFGDLVTAAELAMKIVQVLYYSPKASEEYQGVMAELVSLHHELILINDAIRLDTSSGPGELIRYSVAMEVTRCRDEMQRFLDKTKDVAATGMVGILNKVWWAASEQKELRALRESVARRRAALSVLIGLSNLIISTATRDEVRACRETMQELTTTLKPVPHHVVEDMVFVVDPLGDVIQISMIYGLKYEDLHRIIQAYYPKDRAGSRHISEGSYHLLPSTDGTVWQPSQSGMGPKLEPGMTLEMSMLLRARANFLEQRRTCPRCKQSKSEPISQTGSGWRKCLRCSKFFQVVPDYRWRQDQKSSHFRRFNFVFNFIPSHGTPKDGPQKNADDGGVEHFRRIEFFCVEGIPVGT
ncbi:hypothetical protein MVEN_01341000 [Mycena venus]|uniref:Ubiquitin-like domain-containing protein n=1 Tax=Mycena venus TaxID=2733690 RepID=A0A8H6XZA0_9AGAR|nr:hypothetical protein MVEN_01341000 [Mycena venus]